MRFLFQKNKSIRTQQRKEKKKKAQYNLKALLLSFSINKTRHALGYDLFCPILRNMFSFIEKYS